MGAPDAGQTDAGNRTALTTSVLKSNATTAIRLILNLHIAANAAGVEFDPGPFPLLSLSALPRYLIRRPVTL